VTESEWLACTDVQKKMLDFLQGKTSDRKMRLFICVCCRLVWDLLDDGTCRKSIEVGERFADGMADETERKITLGAVNLIVERIHEEEDSPRGYGAASATAYACCRGGTASPLAWSAALYAAAAADMHLIYDEAGPSVQLDCLRDIIGNPFRPVTISPVVLAWNDATVVRLAQTAYDERHLPEGTLDKTRLAVLADALEEAGCTDAEILDHLRSPGPHVRGCWPVDLCLGKS
jgi:hypothetical protein